MKNLFTLIIGTVFTICCINAQEAPPQAFSFKAIITKGQFVAVKQTVGLRVSILKNFDNRTPVYIETFRLATNINGQIDIEIGQGNVESGSFPSIPWSSDEFFIRLEVDVKGGTNYQFLSETQLLSVPYALYAGDAGPRPKSENIGDMEYWNGKEWILLQPGLNGQILIIKDGVPTWSSH